MYLRLCFHNNKSTALRYQYFHETEQKFVILNDSKRADGGGRVDIHDKYRSLSHKNWKAKKKQ